ncbi:hypothetical protein [Thioalkalivibrio sp. HK1]|uniref:hypothetical protein n=1 Tax=Thioalkalivibrio sp. HK1 TaxID=1469245 RepID=UPI00046E6EDF|nr:hypothetical protein [Thioalkalivibrio sp. HK1]
MPYFVYRVRSRRVIGSIRDFERIDAFSNYREARTLARRMRRKMAADDTKAEDLDDGQVIAIRVVFAADEAQAEGLLSEHRPPRPLGEEA